MIKIDDLNADWNEIINLKDSITLSWPVMPLRDGAGDSALIGRTYFGRHIDIWVKLINLLLRIPPQEQGLRILITAMSIGCELYDAARIAGEKELYNRHPGTVFYGHDISEKFTRRAQDALYPQHIVPHNMPRRKRYLRDSKDYEGYLEVHPDIKNRVKILPASDARDLSGWFDVVVCNYVNPQPSDYDGFIAHLRGLSRHFTMYKRRVVGLSHEYGEHTDPEERCAYLFQEPLGTLPGSDAEISIPQML